MSRPEDSLTTQPGHPAGWPRPNDGIARDPVTGRPLQQGQAEAWPSATQAYHYPGASAQAAAQHYQPAPPRTQPGQRADHYQQAGSHQAQPQGWPTNGTPGTYAPQPAAPEPHWPGDRVPYQNLTTGEPRTSFDTGAYAPPHYGHDGSAQGGYAPAGGYQPGQYGATFGEPDPHGQYAGADQGYDPRTGQPYYQDQYAQGYGQTGTALDVGQPMAATDPGYEADYADEPPRKRRGLLVAGALVCAVAVGGGLAFVYKTFGQSGKRIGAPPVVAKMNTPAKVAPTDPQGKQFDNANKKVLSSRLEEGGSSTATAAASATGPTSSVPGMIVSMPGPPSGTQIAAAAASDTGGPSTRSVQTVPIGRDGNPVGSQAAVTPRVPGIQIDNNLNAPPQMRAGVPPAEAASPPPQAAKPQAQRLAATPPPAAAEAPVGAAPAQPAPKPKAALPKRDPAATAPAPAAPAAAGGTGGYVAVLSSQKDRAAALRVYADLAQKYPDQLGSRQPEVQEANVTNRQTGASELYQRLVVGPPASQQQARELCSQLKAAGHTGDCWVKAY